MATGTTTQVEIPQPVTRTRIVLTLSLNEAEALALILGRCGGSPGNTRRKHTDSIAKGLREAGLCSSSVLKTHPAYTGNAWYVAESIIHTGIQFQPEPAAVIFNPEKD